MRLFGLISLLLLAAPSAALADNLAQLRMPRLAIDVAVYQGTSQQTLALGAGAVVGTALPGQEGNAAISAHRYSHFKPLQNVRVGDVVELDVAGGTQRYRVEDVFITDALDVSVLDASSRQILTLITCYPFDYDGFAPDRLIVRAARQAEAVEGKDKE